MSPERPDPLPVWLAAKLPLLVLKMIDLTTFVIGMCLPATIQHCWLPFLKCRLKTMTTMRRR